MAIFNHVQIKVKNLRASSLFYHSLFNTLGYKVVLHIEDTVIGYGTSVHDMFEIRQATIEYPRSESVHLAFNAPSMEKVQAFYETAIKHGAQCNGKPGYRPEYEDGYYAAFIIDPDGHNIEAVYKAPG